MGGQKVREPIYILSTRLHGANDPYVRLVRKGGSLGVDLSRNFWQVEGGRERLGLNAIVKASTTLVIQSALGARRSAGIVAAHGEVPDLVPELRGETQEW